MAEKPRDARQRDVRHKADEQQPRVERPPEPKTETQSPEAVQKDVEEDDRFQSTDN